MCSSPKGGTTKPMLSSHVESLTGDMSSADYSNMVQRANESYEHRQKELKEYRKTHQPKNLLKHEKADEISFMDKVKIFFHQTVES